MNKKLLAFFLIAAVSLALAAAGCKGRVEKAAEAPQLEAPVEDMSVAEPDQTVAIETIPPTAAPEIKETPASLPSEKTDRTRDIQRALKNAGFYTGAIDGKLGPKTKLAIEEFQKAKGLKVDGKVGPKTWAELEKHLTQ